MPCIKIAESGVYDLSSLKNQQTDWKVQDKLGNTVYFNFCYYTDTDVGACGDSLGDNFAYMSARGTCSQLTSDSPGAEIVEASERTSLVDPTQTQEGVRIERAGGSECPQDSLRQLTFTVDVWCNPAYEQMPQDIEVLTEMDEYPTDPCNIYISMEHADGCVFWDMRPPMKVLGALMVGCGVILMIQGMRMQKTFMRFLVRLVVFFGLLALFYQLHFFDRIDPTALSKRGATEGYALVFACLIMAFIGQYVAGIIFQQSLRFGPTLIGAVAGWWAAIYLIISLNGAFGYFAAQGATDFVSPLWATIIEIFGVMFGGTIGNCYSFIFIVGIQTAISSYLVMRGCTLLILPGYPSEFIIMEAATSETNSILHLGWAFYLYVLWFLIMWVWTFRVQFDKIMDETGGDGIMSYDLSDD